MHGETLSIFFHLPARDPLGLKYVDGKLRCLQEKVVLQYKVRDRVFKPAGDGLDTIEFPYLEIEEVEYLGGWFRQKLVLKTCDPATLDTMPGSDLGRVTMLIARKSKREARKIEAFVDFRKSQELAEESHRRWTRVRDEEEPSSGET